LVYYKKKVQVFCDVTQYRLVNNFRRFEGT